ncbi:ISL3-like element ISPfr1 family transposase [Propionibacterium freudenreichii]|uniref:ISL3-like element ISPfr1 family transposase n=2 Tax=Propionibacterium freudenreichii TaxID=1744 RepID=UPI002549E146|nr:ISL3-like element ISPfr1 family transposase [Propionibacterium freudenreichii]MDK9349917.1 ISL3-like element ISPfr1 family transposase [Propionibacterium freudenreichii]
MSHPTFTTPCLTTFCGLDELGLEAVGQRLDPDRAVIECRVVEPDRWCRECGCEGAPRDTVIRRLAHEPFGHRPTTLLIRVRRYKCCGCGRVWRQDTTAAAPVRAKISRGGLAWGLAGLVLDHLSVTRVTAGLGVSWSAANDAILAEGRRRLIDDPARFEGVTTIGVDEHVWRHTRHGDTYVTVIIDLTPVRDKTGPARLLDMVAGRSKAVFKTWLAARPKPWREGIEVVAMDGFTGFKTAAAEELPDAAPVMDPFHVIRLAGDALENCRRRVQHDVFGRRGMKGDPLYQARRTLLTGAGLLTDKQQARLDALFADDRHVEVEATWGIYQDMITAYRDKDRGLGRFFLAHTIDKISASVPEQLVEIRKLARTLTQRASDVLGYFDRPGTSNGPTEAINGRLEHLRGTALGFRNLSHYIARSLLEAGGFRPALHPRS